MAYPAAGVLCAVISAIAGLFAFAADAFAQDQINVRFSWKLKGEYAPLYMAQELGLFKAENLDVRLGEGAGSQAALGALALARRLPVTVECSTGVAWSQSPPETADEFLQDADHDMHERKSARARRDAV
jgi:hypothetical protein